MASNREAARKFHEECPEVGKVVEFLEKVMGLSTGKARVVGSNAADLSYCTNIEVLSIEPCLYWKCEGTTEENVRTIVRAVVRQGALINFTEDEILGLKWSELTKNHREGGNLKLKKDPHLFDAEIAELLLKARKSRRWVRAELGKEEEMFDMTETKYPIGTIVENVTTGSGIVVRIKVPKKP